MIACLFPLFSPLITSEIEDGTTQPCVWLSWTRNTFRPAWLASCSKNVKLEQAYFVIVKKECFIPIVPKTNFIIERTPLYVPTKHCTLCNLLDNILFVHGLWKEEGSAKPAFSHYILQRGGSWGQGFLKVSVGSWNIPNSTIYVIVLGIVGTSVPSSQLDVYKPGSRFTSFRLTILIGRSEAGTGFL